MIPKEGVVFLFSIQTQVVKDNKLNYKCTSQKLKENKKIKRQKFPVLRLSYQKYHFQFSLNFPTVFQFWK